ncbi:hypothetical protein HQ544_04210 [Candidatus Falkowbacteria bacterium]|nr:hypothetical protein [Candidatus Falkowbacteria bacterium]
MSTQFNTVDEAKDYAAACAGVSPKKTTFEKVEGLQVAGMEAMLLDDPDTSEELKQQIREKMNAQQGFKFTNHQGQEVKIVIGPFRDGFDLWLVGENGLTFRV